jgi:hypothetical protein
MIVDEPREHAIEIQRSASEPRDDAVRVIARVNRDRHRQAARDIRSDGGEVCMRRIGDDGRATDEQPDAGLSRQERVDDRLLASWVHDGPIELWSPARFRTGPSRGRIVRRGEQSPRGDRRRPIIAPR